MTEPVNGIRYVCLLDTETTSLEPPPIGKTVEVAVMLFDVRHAQAVASFASLIRSDSNEAQSVNGIPAEMLSDLQDPELVWRAVRWVIGRADIVIAHNAEFDRKFVPDLGKPWVCSENDIQWPGRARGGSLAHLALSLGLGVASAHRAAADVDTLARIFTRLAEMGHALEPILIRAMRPKVMCHSLAPFEKKDEVKAAGFRWDPDGKMWWRRMPLEDTKELSFKVRVVA